MSDSIIKVPHKQKFEEFPFVVVVVFDVAHCQQIEQSSDVTHERFGH